MRELAVELKQLRMHGMAGAWADLVEQGGSAALESRLQLCAPKLTSAPQQLLAVDRKDAWLESKSAAREELRRTT